MFVGEVGLEHDPGRALHHAGEGLAWLIGAIVVDRSVATVGKPMISGVIRDTHVAPSSSANHPVLLRRVESDVPPACPSRNGVRAQGEMLAPADHVGGAGLEAGREEGDVVGAHAPAISGRRTVVVDLPEPLSPTSSQPRPVGSSECGAMHVMQTHAPHEEDADVEQEASAEFPEGCDSRVGDPYLCSGAAGFQKRVAQAGPRTSVTGSVAAPLRLATRPCMKGGRGSGGMSGRGPSSMMRSSGAGRLRRASRNQSPTCRSIRELLVRSLTEDGMGEAEGTMRESPACVGWRFMHSSGKCPGSGYA